MVHDITQTMTDERIQTFSRSLREALSVHSDIVVRNLFSCRVDGLFREWTALVEIAGSTRSQMLLTYEPFEASMPTAETMSDHRTRLMKSARRFALYIIADALATGMMPAGAEAVDKVWG